MAHRTRERRSRRRGEASPFRLTRRRLLGLGLAGAAVGGGLVSTGAQSTINAFRSNQINAASDPDALLGLSGIETTAQMPTFTNQTGSPITVTLSSTDDIQFDPDNLGTWYDPPISFSLTPGESQVVNVRGSGSFAEVTIDAVIQDGAATIGSISAVRSFAIPAAGNILEVSGTFKSAGKSGQYEFDLENVGSVDATLVAIGVRGTTNPNAIEVSKGKILTVDNVQVMSNVIPVDSTDLTTDTRVDFDIQNAQLGAGETKTFQFDRFQKVGSNTNADMTEQDIKITIYSSDGGSATTNICFGSCDF